MTAFLDTLGVGHDASERDVRRAYAARLKRIDAEADPAAFQALREAYETALGWLKHRDAGGLPMNGGARHDTPAAAVEATGNDDAPEDDARVAQAPHAAAHPYAIAAEVFDEIFISPCEHAAMAHERLRRALDDPRLVDLEAREFFEGRVAREIAHGWRPGHHLLWAAAIAVFSWDTDPARLRCFGDAGHVLDAALVEQALFDRQPDDHRKAQRELILKLRTDSQPQELDLVQNQRMLEWLLLAFPNWIGIQTDAREVTHWREAHAALPVAYQSLVPPHPLPLDPQPAAESAAPVPHIPETQSGGSFPWWWVLFILMPVVSRCAG